MEFASNQLKGGPRETKTVEGGGWQSFSGYGTVISYRALNEKFAYAATSKIGDAIDQLIRHCGARGGMSESV